MQTGVILVVFCHRMVVPCLMLQGFERPDRTCNIVFGKRGSSNFYQYKQSTQISQKEATPLSRIVGGTLSCLCTGTNMNRRRPHTDSAPPTATDGQLAGNSMQECHRPQSQRHQIEAFHLARNGHNNVGVTIM
jgi:hypothetical protein